MKMFKRMLSVVTATVMSGICAVSNITPIFNASANGSLSSRTITDNRDVDGNGVVDLADLVLISKYLAGDTYEPNYNKFDVNKSLTIDYSDYESVFCYNFGKTYSSSYYSKTANNGSGGAVPYPTNINGFSPNYAATDTQPREYIRVSYEYPQSNGMPTVLDNYKLYPTTPNARNSSIHRTIIGVDDRVPASVHDPECKGIVVFDNGGTGFIVGDHQIATAAHVVYGSTIQYGGYGWRKDLSIRTCNSNGIISGKHLNILEVHIPQLYHDYLVAEQYDKNLNYRDYDYALVTVSNDLSKYPHFEIGSSYNLTTFDYSNIPLITMGHPTAMPGDTRPKPTSNPNVIFWCEGRLRTIDKPYQIAFTMDVTNGHSGSPVYTITDEVINGTHYKRYSAIGIVAYNGVYSNTGTLMTKFHLQFYNNNHIASDRFKKQ